jgi:predicted DNA-binding transcriptional regulator AlpA
MPGLHYVSVARNGERAMSKRILFQEDLHARGLKLNHSTIWRKQKQGTFPKHFFVGNRRAWYEDVIDSYIESLGANVEKVA